MNQYRFRHPQNFKIPAHLNLDISNTEELISIRVQIMVKVVEYRGY